MKTLKIYNNLKLEAKRVILRVDFNVPMKKSKVSDDTRIRGSLPTINTLIKKNAKIIIISHLGRPENHEKEFSLAPIAKHLKKLIHHKVTFIENPFSDEASTKIQKMKNKDIIVLENIRYFPEEEKNDNKFAKKLAKLGDIYINDAFAASHRKHASVYELARLLPSYAGDLMQKEVNALGKILKKSKKPTILILGGAKIDTKIGLITNFMKITDYYLVGGALANTFLLAEGFDVGESYCEKNKVKVAQETMLTIEKKREHFILPEDAIVASKTADRVKTLDIPVEDVMGDMKMLDIGIKTAKKFVKYISEANTIIWNGPMGLFENKPFLKGTKLIAKAVARATKNGKTTILGGGDTIDAIKKAGFKEKNYTHVSTGGGAMLEFLEGKKLPGIEVLMK